MSLVVLGYRIGPLLKRTWQEILEDNILGLAAQTAYYFFFSLFPILLFITPLLGMLVDAQAVIDWIEQQMQGAIPPETFILISSIVQDVVLSEDAPGLASVGALLALWAGSNVFNTLAGALNVAYDLTEDRPWWKTRLIAIAMVFLSGIVLGTGFVTFVAGHQLIDFLSGLLGLSDQAQRIWTVVQFALATGMLVALAFLTLYLLPNTRQSKRKVLVGAVLTTALWIAATLLFRTYVVNFGNYNATYGAIGGVIVLLTWMYLSMLVVLVGGELTSELQKGTGAIHGQSGVVLHGRVAVAGVPSRASVE